jgi:hypothetical protein
MTWANEPCGWGVPLWTVPINTLNPAVTGTAAMAASEILNMRTAMQFGACSMTIRPCSENCFGQAGWGGFEGGYGTWWQWGTYPRPLWWNGAWFNVTCGSCQGNCSCSLVSQFVLPTPVNTITDIKVDGVILTPGVDYRIDDFRLAVRLGGGMWPICNDLTKADTEVGTWSVTLTVGEDLPTVGQMAYGELATQFAKLLNGDKDCLLGKPVQQLVRQGVTMNFLDPNAIFANGMIGLYLCDMFVSAVNPSKLTSRAGIYDPDRDVNRITG